MLLVRSMPTLSPIRRREEEELIFSHKAGGRLRGAFQFTHTGSSSGSVSQYYSCSIQQSSIHLPAEGRCAGPPHQYRRYPLNSSLELAVSTYLVSPPRFWFMSRSRLCLSTAPALQDSSLYAHQALHQRFNPVMSASNFGLSMSPPLPLRANNSTFPKQRPTQLSHKNRP